MGDVGVPAVVVKKGGKQPSKPLLPGKALRARNKAKWTKQDEKADQTTAANAAEPMDNPTYDLSSVNTTVANTAEPMDNPTYDDKTPRAAKVKAKNQETVYQDDEMYALPETAKPHRTANAVHKYDSADKLTHEYEILDDTTPQVKKTTHEYDILDGPKPQVKKITHEYEILHDTTPQVKKTTHKYDILDGPKPQVKKIKHEYDSADNVHEKVEHEYDIVQAKKRNHQYDMLNNHAAKKVPHEYDILKNPFKKAEITHEYERLENPAQQDARILENTAQTVKKVAHEYALLENPAQPVKKVTHEYALLENPAQPANVVHEYDVLENPAQPAKKPAREHNSTVSQAGTYAKEKNPTQNGRTHLESISEGASLSSLATGLDTVAHVTEKPKQSVKPPVKAKKPAAKKGTSSESQVISNPEPQKRAEYKKLNSKDDELLCCNQQLGIENTSQRTQQQLNHIYAILERPQDISSQPADLNQEEEPIYENHEPELDQEDEPIYENHEPALDQEDEPIYEPTGHTQEETSSNNNCTNISQHYEVSAWYRKQD